MSARAALAAVALGGAMGCGEPRRAQPPPAPEPAVIVQPPAAAAAAPAPAPAYVDPAAAYLRDHYAKFEYRIPMRDGVHLFTAVYVPNDAGPAKRYPFVIQRTPYGAEPYGPTRFPVYVGDLDMVQDGYIYVFQDVRGRHMSEGELVQVRPILAAHRGETDVDESTDAYDTIEWLVRHVEHDNGKAALVGGSYPGFYAAAGAIDSHPALAAIAPEAPIGDWWIGDDLHRNGALCLQQTFGFLDMFFRAGPAPTDAEGRYTHDYGTPDAYQFFLDLGPVTEIGADDFAGDVPFWNDVVAHPDYDAWWQARALRPRLERVRAASLVTGGWYDMEDLYGTLEVYRGIEEHNPRTTNTLVMGPWYHGGWYDPTTALGDTDFGVRTDDTWAALRRAFLAHHLKGAPDPELPEAYVFETGANRWRSFSAWPPAGVAPRTYWLAAGGALATRAPGDADAGGFDEYPSDPAHPVPYTANAQTRYWTAAAMAEDQRFASRRPDVLTYQTAPLEDDVTIAGPIEVELVVSTTGTDADWVVKLVDAYPGNKDPDKGAVQLLVRGEPFRGRYRDSLEAPKPFVPGEPAAVRFTLDDVMHTFARGHRIMIQVQSSWFPFIDRNPQTFVPSIYQAARADFVEATHRVHHASKVTLAVLP